MQLLFFILGICAAGFAYFTNLDHATSVQRYEGQTPPLEISEFYKGELVGYGTLQNWRGVVIKRFKITMNGAWKEEQGTLLEEYITDSKEKLQRSWQITRHNQHHFTATAEGIEDVAIGAQYGNAAHMTYHYTMPLYGKSILFDASDQQFLIDDHHLMRTVSLHKLGIPCYRFTMLLTKEGKTGFFGAESTPSFTPEDTVELTE